MGREGGKSNKLAELIKTRSSYQRFSIGKVFSKILPNHRKTPMLKSHFNKVAGPMSATLLKSYSLYQKD